MQMLYFGLLAKSTSVFTSRSLQPYRHFSKICSLPQPTDDEIVEGLPLVQLSEDASFLGNLVSLLYGQRAIKPGSYEKVFGLLAACQIYHILLIQPEIRDKVDLGRFPMLAKATLSAYAIASSLGLIPDMENAARLTLGQTFNIRMPWEKGCGDGPAQTSLTQTLT
jgi:hypothetical protein